MHLGGLVGAQKFKDLYITAEVDEWIRQLELLSKIATTEAQPAYWAFAVGFKQKVTYTMGTIPDIS